MKFSIAISMVLLLIASQVNGQCWKHVRRAKDGNCPANYTYGAGVCWQDCPAAVPYNCKFMCTSNMLQCGLQAVQKLAQIGVEAAKAFQDPSSATPEKLEEIIKNTKGEYCIKAA